MCVYCSMGDWGRTWIPPAGAGIGPTTTIIQTPWTQEMLDQWRELIQSVKRMEEKLMSLGEQTPCVEDPEKLNYLDEIQKLLDQAKDAGP